MRLCIVDAALADLNLDFISAGEQTVLTFYFAMP